MSEPLTRSKTSQKTLARNAVYRAIKSGRLVRRSSCERCGRECATEASHDDYSRPLEVEWLCRDCHCKKDLPTHCRKGHEYTPENTRIHADGRRICRICDRTWARLAQRKRRAAARAQIKEGELSDGN